MRVFVTGGTGTIGRPLVRELHRRGAEVSVLTRSKKKAARLPSGIRGVVGSIFDLDLLSQELEKSDAFFLNCEISIEEPYQGILAADVAAKTRVKHLVYLSGQDPQILFTPPHAGTKLITEKTIQALGVPYTFLRPNTFMQNDLQVRDAILFGGVYPIPFGNGGVARVDVEDIAQVAAIVLTAPQEHIGKIYTIAGPDTLTGESIAGQWSEALGKPIRYLGDDLDKFEAMLRTLMSIPIAHDIRMLYEAYQTKGLPGRSEDLDQVEKLLGRPLGTFSRFTESTAKKWLALPPTAKLAAGFKFLWARATL